MFEYFVLQMVKCLILTIIIELIVGLIIGIRNKKDLLNILLVNAITNPVVAITPVYFNLLYGHNIRRLVLIILEIIAFLFEGIIYKKYLHFNKVNPFIISLLLNISSYFIGGIIDKYILLNI